MVNRQRNRPQRAGPAKFCSSGNMQHPSCRDRSHRRKGGLIGKTLLRSQTEGRQPQSEGQQQQVTGRGELLNLSALMKKSQESEETLGRACAASLSQVRQNFSKCLDIVSSCKTRPSQMSKQLPSFHTWKIISLLKMFPEVHCSKYSQAHN